MPSEYYSNGGPEEQQKSALRIVHWNHCFCLQTTRQLVMFDVDVCDSHSGNTWNHKYIHHGDKQALTLTSTPTDKVQTGNLSGVHVCELRARHRNDNLHTGLALGIEPMTFLLQGDTGTAKWNLFQIKFRTQRDYDGTRSN